MNDIFKFGGYAEAVSTPPAAPAPSTAPFNDPFPELVECGNSVALGFDTDDIPIGGSLVTTSVIKSDGGTTLATLNSTVERTGQDAFKTTIEQSDDPDLATAEEGN